VSVAAPHAGRGWSSLRLGRRLVLGVPYLWLGLFFLVPLLIVFGISFSTPKIAMPPIEPLFSYGADRVLQLRLYLSNYTFIAQDSLYVAAFANSLKVAFFSTLLALLLGYPMAYGIARAPRNWRSVLFLLVVLPFFTSFLLRVYAWIGLLSRAGPINSLLLSLGVINEPLVMLQTDFAVYLGMVYSYLPFMVLPLYSAIEKLDPSLLEAAADLGCRPVKAFFRVTLPLTSEGILAGCLLVFIPSVGEYVIPAVLGGPGTLMIGRVLWEEFFNNRDWPLASAVAVLLLLLLVGFIVILQRVQARESAGE
jgi:putrescine transport system permease protein